MKKEEAFWDRLSAKFDERDRHFQKTNDRILELTAGYLRANHAVLDLGCATGTVSLAIAPHVRKVHGIDISAKMIEAARRKAREGRVENVDFAQTTIFNPELPPSSFDVILALNIFLHLADLPAALGRIHELLKPGGLIISMTACFAERRPIGNVLLRLLMALLVGLRIFPKMQFLDKSGLESLMALEHLDVMQTEQLGGVPVMCFVVARKSELLPL